MRSMVKKKKKNLLEYPFTSLNASSCTANVEKTKILFLGSVHYLWGRGGWQMRGGGQAKFTPLFRGGGGVRKVLLWLWGRGGRGQKSLKVDMISFGFF